jgi:hypothetical protein
MEVQARGAESAVLYKIRGFPTSRIKKSRLQPATSVQQHFPQSRPPLREWLAYWRAGEDNKATSYSRLVVRGAWTRRYMRRNVSGQGLFQGKITALQKRVRAFGYRFIVVCLYKMNGRTLITPAIAEDIFSYI